MNAIGPYQCEVNSNYLTLSANKPLHKPMLTRIFVAMWPNKLLIGWLLLLNGVFVRYHANIAVWIIFSQEISPGTHVICSTIN